MTLAVNIAQGGSNNVTFRNRIINGGMVIDQRNAGAEVNPAVNGSYYLDRWQANTTAASKYKIGQNAGSVTPPVGFTKYLGVTSLSAYSIATTDLFAIQQRIEGYNVADLGWGTTNAKPITLSFWVYSSLTGTFGVSFVNSDVSWTYPTTYTIPTANTWTYITVTAPGSTTGTWVTDNGLGMRVYFGMGIGTALTAPANSWIAGGYYGANGCVSVVGTSGATFYITGVQLEAGTTASPFEYRQYGTELALCQRYYYQSACALGSTANDYEWLYSLNTGNQYRRNSIRHPVTMRAAPTVGNLTVRLNDASTTSGSSQYITNASWSAAYTAASGTDYAAINGYTITAEL